MNGGLIGLELAVLYHVLFLHDRWYPLWYWVQIRQSFA